MKQSINEQLSRLGFKPEADQLIGQGGQLATYLVDVKNQKNNEKKKVVIKEVQADRDLASIYGYEPASMLKSESRYTEVLNSEGLGPKLLFNCEEVVIREFAEGSTLSKVFSRSDRERAGFYFKESLLFLENVFLVVERAGLKGYLDFNCDNILLDEAGDFSLIDHEWAIFQFQTHEDLCVNTIYKFLRSVLRSTEFTFDALFEWVRENAYLSSYMPRVQAQLVAGYYNVNDVSFQLSVTSSDELKKQLLEGQTGTPREILEQLCSRLSDRSIRYCLARRYDDLFSGGEYREKDIDLFVDPDDYHSFILLAQETGFILYNLTKFLYYSDVTGQVVFLDICLQKPVELPSVLDVRQVVSSAVSRHGCRIISDANLFVFLVVNAAIQKKPLAPKYYGFLQEKLMNHHFDIAYIEMALQEAFGGSVGEKILKLIQVGSWGALEDIKIPRFGKQGSRIDLRKRVGYLVTSGPRLIAMLGVDGAGKSTTALAVKNALAGVNLQSENYYLGCYYPPSGRGQSFILPTDLMMIVGYKLLLAARKIKIVPKKLTSKAPSVQKYDAKQFVFDAEIDELEWRVPLEPGGECSMLIFRVYAWILAIDCALMGAKLRMIQRGSFVFTDRYFYDLITFLGRNHVLSRWVARFFEPDAALFLYASPDIQVWREPRHPLSEIKTNQSLYRSVPKLNPKVNWHEISTEVPVRVVVQRVLFLCMTAPRRKSIFKAIANISKSVFGRFLSILLV